MTSTAEPLIIPIGLEHINIKARDIERSIEFYTHVLGLRLVRVNRDETGRIRFAAVRSGDALIDIVPDDGDWDPQRGGFNHVALLIEPTDLDELASKFTELDVPITEGPVSNRQGAYGNGFALYIEDPDGHGIELKHYALPNGPDPR